MKVVSFGEIMLRLSPEGYKRLSQADRFDAIYAGTEANVAVSLANFGIDTEYVTKLPDSPIGESALCAIRKMGVGTSHIAKGGNRLGIFFYEKGAAQRQSVVLYDRAGSSICEASHSDFDWQRIFAGADWYHITGITPALSDSLADIVLASVCAAKENGLTVSCDLNYRSKLWTPEKAGKVMDKILPYADYCTGIGVYEAKELFHITTDKSGTDALIDIAGQLMKKYNLTGYATTLRNSISSSDEELGGLFYNGQAYFSKVHSMHIVDRIGGGDAFVGGLIYALLNHYEPQHLIDFATAAAVLKHSIEGDFNMISVREAEALATGSTSGRIKR